MMGTSNKAVKAQQKSESNGENQKGDRRSDEDNDDKRVMSDDERESWFGVIRKDSAKLALA
jgi:hypothetical protein